MSYYGNQPPTGNAPYAANPPPQQGVAQYPPNAYYPPQQPPPPYSAQPYTNQPRMPAQHGYPPMPPQPYGGQAYPGQHVPSQPPSTVLVQGGFDAGARFDVTGPTLPPPPPGCPPTAAQYAAAQGQNVVVTQRPGNFMTGGSDGGTVIW